ncbi:MAG: acyl carrier protein [Leptospiraceae bacterium]|nr:acyl carrier protein [Leptospiraceae bacterium]
MSGILLLTMACERSFPGDYTPSEQKVIEITARVLGQPVEQIRLEQDYRREYSADELEIVEIALFLEDEYAFTISDPELDGVRTPADFVRIVDRHRTQPDTQAADNDKNHEQ